MDQFTDPGLDLFWREGDYDAEQMTLDPSKVTGLFKWNTPNESEAMSAEATIACLEHYVEWSPGPS